MQHVCKLGSKEDIRGICTACIIYLALLKASLVCVAYFFYASYIVWLAEEVRIIFAYHLRYIPP